MHGPTVPSCSAHACESSCARARAYECIRARARARARAHATRDAHAHARMHGTRGDACHTGMPYARTRGSMPGGDAFRGDRYRVAGSPSPGQPVGRRRDMPVRSLQWPVTAFGRRPWYQTPGTCHGDRHGPYTATRGHRRPRLRHGMRMPGRYPVRACIVRAVLDGYSARCFRAAVSAAIIASTSARVVRYTVWRGRRYHPTSPSSVVKARATATRTAPWYRSAYTRA